VKKKKQSESKPLTCAFGQQPFGIGSPFGRVVEEPKPAAKEEKKK